MKNHNKLRKLILINLGNLINPTARELYHEIKVEEPTMTNRYEFKAFVKLINSFKEVKPIELCKGKPKIYKLA
jgi:hypothetical protein